MPRTLRVRDVAAVVRSKNAGPFRLTVDILFKDEATYRRVKASKTITPELIARLYGLRPDQITDFVEFDPGLAIKATFPRPVSSGAVGDTDVYGAQQHAPLLDIPIPPADER
jgi:Domain of unknown function (DUF4387)